MTIRHYLAGGVILVVLAAGGYWFNAREDCENHPDAGCLLDEAEAALAEGEKSFMTASLFVELALTRAGRGEAERAEALYKEADELAKGADHPLRRGMAWTMMGATAVQAGDLEHGRAFFAQANRAAWDSEEQTARKVNETRNILSMQASAGDLEGALESVATLRTDLWRAQTILMIAEGLADAGKTAQISEILPHAQKALDAMEDAQVKLNLLPLLAGIQAAAGDMEAAQATAGGIEDILLRSNAWGQIAEAQARAGDVDGALKSFTSIEHFSARDWTLWPIAVAQAKAGDFAAAEESVGKINDYNARTQARGDIAAQYAAAGQLDRANGIAEKLKEGFPRDRARRMIVEALAEAGEYASAVEIAKKFERPGYREMLLVQVATAQVKAGQIDGARETLGSIETPAKRGQALSEIAAAEARAGNTKQAVTTARAIETPQWRATALHKVALAMGGG